MSRRFQYASHRYALVVARPNPDALRVLQEAYDHLPPRTSAAPWTRETATMLGVLYTRAWSTPPTPARMEAHYCLPHQAAILRLFGSHRAFHAAIDAANVPLATRPCLTRRNLRDGDSALVATAWCARCLRPMLAWPVPHVCTLWLDLWPEDEEEDATS